MDTRPTREVHLWVGVKPLPCLLVPLFVDNTNVIYGL